MPVIHSKFQQKKENGTNNIATIQEKIRNKRRISFEEQFVFEKARTLDHTIFDRPFEHIYAYGDAPSVKSDEDFEEDIYKEVMHDVVCDDENNPCIQKIEYEGEQYIIYDMCGNIQMPTPIEDYPKRQFIPRAKVIKHGMKIPKGTKIIKGKNVKILNSTDDNMNHKRQFEINTMDDILQDVIENNGKNSISKDGEQTLTEENINVHNLVTGRTKPTYVSAEHFMKAENKDDVKTESDYIDPDEVRVDTDINGNVHIHDDRYVYHRDGDELKRTPKSDVAEKGTPSPPQLQKSQTFRFCEDNQLKVVRRQRGGGYCLMSVDSNKNNSIDSLSTTSGAC